MSEYNGKNMTWDFDIPMFQNRFFWQDILKMFGIPVAVVAAFGISLKTWEDIKYHRNPFDFGFLRDEYTWFAFGFFAVVIIATLLAAFAIYRNRMSVRFHIDDRGIRAELTGGTQKKSGIVNKLLIILAVMLRKPRAAGPALASPQSFESEWEGVERLREYPNLHAVALYNSWRRVLVVYCTPDNYAPALEIIKNGISDAAPRRRELQADSRAKLKKYAFRGAIALAACAIIAFAVIATVEYLKYRGPSSEELDRMIMQKPEKIEPMAISEIDGPELKQQKILYNKMADAFNKYIDAPESEKPAAYEQYEAAMREFEEFRSHPDK